MPQARAGQPRRPPHPLHPDITRQLARAAHAADLGRRGRHAAAERVLRETAAALDRRGALGEGAVVRVALAQLLVERGRLGPAIELLDEAVSGTVVAGDAGQQVRALVALACAWLEDDRPDRARPLLDRLRVLAPDDPCVGLVEVRLAAVPSVFPAVVPANGAVPAPADDAVPPFWRAAVEQAAVSALVSGGRLAEAGRRVRARLDAWQAELDPLATAVLGLAHLQVVTATGDLALARPVRDEALAWCRRAHAPLRAAEARLLWCAALFEAGRLPEARHERRALRRLERVATPRLLAALARVGEPEAPVRVSMGTRSPMSQLPAFVARVQQADATDEGLRGCLETLVALTGAVTAVLEMPSAESGGSPPLCVTTASVRDDRAHDGVATLRQVGPARLRVRWSDVARVPPDLAPVLDTVATVLTPLVEGWVRLAASPPPVAGLVGVSPPLADIRRAVARAARAPFNVLIEGESGVGKELVARAIHAMGPRASARCCDLNCAALPDDLVEAELFGHARGAFTGAMVDRAGLFEEASGGTLFLDEVAELSPRAQAKLLRVLQQQEVRRVGESASRPIDVRVVAAANRDMRAEVAAGRFRADLLYRLDVIHLRLPPLRERLDDIPVLAEHFWRTAAGRVGTRATLSTGLVERLRQHDWPGNVRELQNVMAALAVVAPPAGSVTAALLPSTFDARESGNAPAHGSTDLVTAAAACARFERDYVEMVLRRCGGNRTQAARTLGLSRQGLLKSLRRLGLTAGE